MKCHETANTKLNPLAVLLSFGRFFGLYSSPAVLYINQWLSNWGPQDGSGDHRFC